MNCRCTIFSSSVEKCLSNLIFACNKFVFSVTEEDVDKPIACVVVPVHGNKVEVLRILNQSPTPSPSPQQEGVK